MWETQRILRRSELINSDLMRSNVMMCAIEPRSALGRDLRGSHRRAHVLLQLSQSDGQRYGVQPLRFVDACSCRRREGRFYQRAPVRLPGEPESRPCPG